MKSFNKISKEELVELENRCWMKHDGLWFYNCLSSFGIENANKLNKAAIKGLAPFEVERTKKVIGYQKEKMENFKDLKAYFAVVKKLFIPTFMNITLSFPKKNVLHWEFEPNNCFAYKGIKRLGAIDQYECGVIYRLECWLHCLCINHRTIPKIDKCLMLINGQCSGDIELTLC